MRVRLDYVSNSSSSSYIVAIDFSKYDFELFIDKVCSKCCGADHASRPLKRDARTRRLNEAALRYGLMCECLYIGYPVVGRIKNVWRRGEEYNHTMRKPGASEEFTPFHDLTSPHVVSRSAGETVSYIDADTIEHEYDEELPAWMSVHRAVMSAIRRPDSFLIEDESLSGNSPQGRARRIVEYARQKAREKIRAPDSEIFCITENTVKNTRDLMRAGYKVKFKSPIASSSELMSNFLDAVEARLKDGETFIFAVAGDSGEGQADTRLYMPYGYSNPFEYTPAQDVRGSFMEY